MISESSLILESSFWWEAFMEEIQDAFYACGIERLWAGMIYMFSFINKILGSG